MNMKTCAASQTSEGDSCADGLQDGGDQGEGALGEGPGLPFGEGDCGGVPQRRGGQQEGADEMAVGPV